MHRQRDAARGVFFVAAHPLFQRGLEGAASVYDDVWAAGATLYLALTGSRFLQHCCEPFARSNGLPAAPIDTRRRTTP